MMEIVWTDESKGLMASEAHALCLGGPGSGKTTMALLKADAEIASDTLLPGQKILFLSFARATIARVEEHASSILRAEQMHSMEISTYHGFSWSLLRSHGYLLTENSPITLLAPPQAAARLSTFEGDDAKRAEKLRLFEEEGLLDFDLFASSAVELLSRSSAIREIVSSRYPIIILDEFQDTDANEWALIKLLGIDSRLIALADPEQRIYEFRGASPTRIPEFIREFSPDQFDFSSANHRSSGTDICVFGNDLLTGGNKGKDYNDVAVLSYPPRRAPETHLSVKIEVFKRRNALIKQGEKNWSIGVLVPTKQLMLDVSDYLATSQVFQNGKKAPSIANEAALDSEGPALAAALIAGLLAGGANADAIAQKLIYDLCEHMRGRKGGRRPSQQQLGLIDGLGGFLDTGQVRGPRRRALADECLAIGNERVNMLLSGDPSADWLTVRRMLEEAEAPELKAVASDARFLKLLNRGQQLRSRLAEIWKATGSYEGAGEAVANALLQEHFAAVKKVYSGIHVMTIHKSKGKQFTEVIIYEGSHQGKIVRHNADDQQRAQALLSLRVGVTRAEQFSTILTPQRDPCPFL